MALGMLLGQRGEALQVTVSANCRRSPPTRGRGLKQAPDVEWHAQLQREAQLVARAQSSRDALQVFLTQGVVAQPLRLALRK